MTKRVIAVGIAVMDKIFSVPAIPDEPIKVFATGYSEIGGGPAATGAVTVARLGGEAVLWARVGDDPVGRRIVEELGEWGVRPRIRLVPGARSGVSGVLVDKDGERLIIAFADPGLDTDPAWLPLAEVAAADAVLADMRWPRASEIVLDAARAAGVPAVLDADLASDDVAHRLVARSDYAVFSRPALTRFAGTDDVAEGLRAAAQVCPGRVGVTLGGEGFAWLEGGNLAREPGFTVETVDTLGAGDVFHGAFALAVAEGRDMRAAARFANAASALKCTRRGGRAGIPDRAEVAALMSLSEEV